MSDKKKGKQGVAEVYTDEQYNKAQAENKIVIDRRGISSYERSGKSEPLDLPGLSSGVEDQPEPDDLPEDDGGMIEDDDEEI